MSETKTTYTHDDVMQALVCLQEFGESGVGFAAANLLQDAMSGRASDCGWVRGDRACIKNGSDSIEMSFEALRLVAMGYHEAPVRAIALRDRCGYRDYDLSDGTT